MTNNPGNRGGRTREPRVSVIMPVYNGGVFLAPAVESILAQTFSDFEFVIVDDASTDATPAYLASLRDPRVRVLRNTKNIRGPASANRGIQESIGEYIARQDADDISEPSRLARQVKVLDSKPEVAVLASGGMGIDEDGNITDHFWRANGKDLDVRWELLFRNVLPHSSLMFRREMIGGGYSPSADVSAVDDYELVTRIARDHQVVAIRDELIRYRIHPASISQTCGELQAKQVVAIAFREVCELTGGELSREVYDDFLAVYRGGGQQLPRLSAEQVRGATEFAAKLQAAFYARAGRPKPEAWRHCAKVRLRWAGHLLRLALRERRDVRWRVSLVSFAVSLVSSAVKLMGAPAIGRRRDDWQ
jgi:glycosyltransferase involved in cell wall biosynthesis